MIPKQRKWQIAAMSVWSLLLAVTACDSAADDVEQLCAPGQSVFCRCPSGTPATQLCDDSGMGFDECGPCGGDVPAPGSGSSGSSPVDPGASGRPILAACEEASECATTLCSSGYCTSPCYKPSDCPYPKAECVEDETSATCVPACASDADCVGFGGSCQTGHAIDGWVVTTCR
jgi:hypothetical protein